jgi:hypothetical protein
MNHIQTKLRRKNQLKLLDELNIILSNKIFKLQDKNKKILKHFPLTINNDIILDDKYRPYFNFKINKKKTGKIYLFDGNEKKSFSLINSTDINVYEYIIDIIRNEISYLKNLYIKNMLSIKHINKYDDIKKYNEKYNTNYNRDIIKIFHFALQKNQTKLLSFITFNNKLQYIANSIIIAISDKSVINIFFDFDVELYIDSRITLINNELNNNNNSNSNINDISNIIICLNKIINPLDTIIHQITNDIIFEYKFNNGKKEYIKQEYHDDTMYDIIKKFLQDIYIGIFNNNNIKFKHLELKKCAEPQIHLFENKIYSTHININLDYELQEVKYVIDNICFYFNKNIIDIYLTNNSIFYILNIVKELKNIIEEHKIKIELN